MFHGLFCKVSVVCFPVWVTSAVRLTSRCSSGHFVCIALNKSKPAFRVINRLHEYEEEAEDVQENEGEDLDFGISINLPEAKGTFTCLNCVNEQCDYLFEISECHHAVKCYEYSQFEPDGTWYRSRGCIHNLQSSHLHCRSSSAKIKQDLEFSVFCCDGSLCNNGSMETHHSMLIKANTQGSDDSSKAWILLPVVLGVAFTIAIILFIIVTLRWYEARRRRECEDTQDGDSIRLDDLACSPMIPKLTRGDDGSAGMATLELTSGSGSGLPLLLQSTLAKQISLQEIIGKGRYGEVWRGVWRGQSVAIKSFFSKDEASWGRETEIYTTTLLRHENILGYIGSDVTSNNSFTQLWVVMDYHPLGSLYDFLNMRTLSEQQFLVMAHSAANGIVHLHTEIFGSNAKPAIAHRDIKSKNILVKNDLRCCIADLGLAVTHKNSSDELHVPQNSRVGTRRYMAPEVLDFTLNTNNFESFRRADMYAFALVLWEMCRRLEGRPGEENILPLDYQPPFFDHVSPDPSFDVMRRVVSVEGIRPVFPLGWNDCPTRHSVALMIQETWHQKPEVRLTSLRMTKNLIKLITHSDPQLSQTLFLT
ncbi:unnamed protein product [Cyprideis torosa]|uniref:receptor protein serine/threonine kinase n=1 Tax=Cyprideis torosa TaxID=163714 RepID=A0A7R8W3R3_9CRUS|nr:unnamed protein product [Cyprideis torosa]CAG0879190.1 unnamed protein product [Cyprideis torosa]